MISASLLTHLACPTCLEPAGCPRCTRPAGHAGCADYAARVSCACGGPDKVALLSEEGGLRCPCCTRLYPLLVDHADLWTETGGDPHAGTLYDDHEFQERLRVSAAPPLLSARVKADLMRGMLDLAPGEAVLDLGCGAGKMALYAQRHGARAAGLDAAPYFLPAAAAAVDLLRGDLRRLPFRKGSFAAAYSIDVLEHLDEDGVRDVLLETQRVLLPAGRLFVYTHAMESSRLASFQRGVNRLAKRLGRVGLIDHEREAMRKADHRNPLRSHEHFDALCAGAGLAVRERRYYNVVFKAVVEDLGLRLVEQVRERRKNSRRTATEDGDRHGNGDVHEHVHGKTGAAAQPGKIALGIGHLLTWLLKLDVVFFGGIRTGPFFALIRPLPPVAPPREPAG